MASPSRSPAAALSCSVCQMFSYTSASFTYNGTSNKYSLFAVLDARLGELKLLTMETSLLVPIDSQPKISGVC